MGFWVGNWLHDPPSKEYDITGKRAVIKHMMRCAKDFRSRRTAA